MVVVEREDGQCKEAKFARKERSTNVGTNKFAALVDDSDSDDDRSADETDEDCKAGLCGEVTKAGDGKLQAERDDARRQKGDSLARN